MNKDLLKKLCYLLNKKNQQRLFIVNIKLSFLYLKVLNVMLREGFIRGFFINTHNNLKVIFILLKHVNGDNLFKISYISNNKHVLNKRLGNFDYKVSFIKRHSKFDTITSNKISLNFSPLHLSPV